MPVYDFKCDACGALITMFVHSWNDAVGQVHRCECGGQLVKQISAPNFKVEGFNAKNGYSK